MHALSLWSNLHIFLVKLLKVGAYRVNYFSCKLCKLHASLACVSYVNNTFLSKLFLVSQY